MENEMNVFEKFSMNEEKLIHALACWTICYVTSILATLCSLQYGIKCIGIGIVMLLIVASFISTFFILKKVCDQYAHFGILLVVVISFLLESNTITEFIYGISMILFDTYLVYDFVIHPALENLKLHKDYGIQCSLTGKEFVTALLKAIGSKFADVLKVIICILEATIRFIFFPLILLLRLLK